MYWVGLGWVGSVVLCSAVSTVLVLLYVMGGVGLGVVVLMLCSAVITVDVLLYVMGFVSVGLGFFL